MFIGLGPLVLVLAVIGTVYAAMHHRSATHGHGLVTVGDRRAAPSHRPHGHRDAQVTAPTVAPRRVRHPALDDSLSAWASAGLISVDQATAIREFEAQATAPSPAAPTRRVPLVAEALGYLGGILGIVGLVLLIARYWPDMVGVGRLALAGGAAAVLVVAGGLLRETDLAVIRLRAFLWAVAAPAVALFAGVAAVEAIEEPSDRTVVLAAAIAVAALETLLWAGRERPVQQALALVAAMVAVGVGASLLGEEGAAGLTLLGVGLVLFTVGWRAWTTSPAVTVLVGGAALMVGPAIAAGRWQGPGLVLASAMAVSVLSLVAARDTEADDEVRVAALVVGVVGSVATGPATIGYFAEQAGIVTGAVVCLLGLVAVGAAAMRSVLVPALVQTFGGVLVVIGAAVTGTQSVAVATLLGLAVAMAMIAAGTVPGQVMLSLTGSVGLLVNVPWAIVHFFPGEGRAPLLILASGGVIVGVAVWLARLGGRFRHELRR